MAGGITLSIPDLDDDLNNALKLAGNDPTLQHFFVTVQMFRNLTNLESKIMAAIDNLNTAVAAIQANTTTLIGTLDSQFQQLKTALAANAAANQDPAIQAAADTLNKTLADEQAALGRDTLPASGGDAGAATGAATTAAPAATPTT